MIKFAEALLQRDCTVCEWTFAGRPLSLSPRCQRKVDKRGTRAERGEEEVEEGKVSAKEYGAEGSDCSVG